MMHHYFFSRKHALVYHARALIACPGGFGTADELFEVLTLLQSGKIQHPETVPVVLLGGRYWRDVVNWTKFLDYGVIAQSDLDRLCFTDSVEEAFTYVTQRLLRWEAVATAQAQAEALAAATAAQSAAAAAHAAAKLAAAEARASLDTTEYVRPIIGGEPATSPTLKPRAPKEEAVSVPAGPAPKLELGGKV